MEQTDLNLNTPTIELSIVMPCLNEALTLPICIKKARGFLDEHGIKGEIIIGDNGSKDGSQEIARALGAVVVDIPRRGYGCALQGCIERARGKYIIMGDSDDSYDFSKLLPFVEQLREGTDLVVGNRFAGGIIPGAMPLLHRYLGNPLLTAFARFAFGAKVGDVYCGLRGFTKSAAVRMDLQSTGMEFALEMIVKATLHKMAVGETPIILHRDGRSRAPHLKTWVDGRRSLSFFLFCSPRLLFFYPGILLIIAGLLGGASVWSGWLNPSSEVLSSLTALHCCGAILVGFQAVFFSILAKTLGIGARLLPLDPDWDKFLAKARLEIGLPIGGILILIGIFLSSTALKLPVEEAGSLAVFHNLIPAIFLLALGGQVVFSSFCLSLLKFGYRKSLWSDRQELAKNDTLETEAAHIQPTYSLPATPWSSGPSPLNQIDSIKNS
jgi:hypothetical protein